MSPFAVSNVSMYHTQLKRLNNIVIFAHFKAKSNILK